MRTDSLYSFSILPLMGVIAFQTPHVPHGISNSRTNHVTMMMTPTDLHDKSSPFEASRRDVVNAAMKGSFLTAALVSGASPAMATNIAKQMMVLEKEFRETVNTKGAPEKHLPKITLGSVNGNADLTMVEVIVPHVMDPEKPHWIQAIWLKEESSGDVAVAKVLPSTEPSPPSLTCGVPKGTRLTPYLYCNLHGLWKGDTFTS